MEHTMEGEFYYQHRIDAIFFNAVINALLRNCDEIIYARTSYHTNQKIYQNLLYLYGEIMYERIKDFPKMEYNENDMKYYDDESNNHYVLATNHYKEKVFLWCKEHYDDYVIIDSDSCGK